MRTRPKQSRTSSSKPPGQRAKPAAPKRKAPSPRARVPFGQPPKDCVGFMALLLARISWEDLNTLNQRKHGAGRPTHVLSRAQLLAGLLFHHTAGLAGSFAEHLYWLLGIDMAESSLSERRQALPWAVFVDLLRRVLRPIPQSSAQSFYQGLRLVAIDGVGFSLPNTSSVRRKCRKGGNQKGKAAFAKLQCAALVELLPHNPLAARLGWKGESEWKLALGLLDHLPEKCLLLADRLHGCGAFLAAALEGLRTRGGHFLVRVKGNLKPLRQVRRLQDGSRIIEVKALEKGDRHRVATVLEVREIRATIRRRGFRPVELRLWTSLLDSQAAPAPEWAGLYAARWEQELYFRELKEPLGINDLLLSQTPETAAQELAARIIGSSLLAEERARLEPGEGPATRLSFIKTRQTLEPLWLTLLLGEDILSGEQKRQLCERFHPLAARRKMPKKRCRSCPRVMRQPHQPWPRKKRRKGSTAPVRVSIVAGRK